MFPLIGEVETAYLWYEGRTRLTKVRSKTLGRQRKYNQFETEYMNADKTGYTMWTERLVQK